MRDITGLTMPPAAWLRATGSPMHENNKVRIRRRLRGARLGAVSCAIAVVLSVMATAAGPVAARPVEAVEARAVEARAVEASDSPRPGDLDTSYGAGQPPIEDGAIWGHAIQADGKSVVTIAYSSESELPPGLDVRRYGLDGRPDPTFAGGRVVTPVRAFSSATDVAIQRLADGAERIVVSGYAGNDPAEPPWLVLARYRLNGQLDAEFGDDGIVEIEMNSDGSWLFPREVAIQPSDGKIVVAGEADIPTATGERSGVMRFNTDGSVDTDYGTAGIAVSMVEATGGVAIQTFQGVDRVVVGGSLYDAANHNSLGLARFTPDGAHVDTFGGGTDGWGFTDVITLGDGSIVAVGSHWANDATHPSTVVAHYAPTGGLLASHLNDELPSLASVAAQRDPASGIEKVLVASNNWDQNYATPSDVALARYQLPLSLDMGFGENGFVSTDLGAWEAATTVAVQPDGKIVVGVATWISGGWPGRGVLLRYHGDAPCAQQMVEFGEVKAKGCFRQLEPWVWEARGGIRINGVDVEPTGAIRLDGRELRLTVDGDAVVAIGDGPKRVAVHVEGGFEWSLEAEVRLDLPPFFDLFGFPVSGDATIAWREGKALVSAAVTMPQLFGNAVGAATLSADVDNGLKLDSVSIRLPWALFGRLYVRNLGITYEFAADRWKGYGDIGIFAGPELQGSFSFAGGKFESARIALDHINVHIGDGLYLQKIALDVTADPFVIDGSAEVSLGPAMARVTLLSLEGHLRYAIEGDTHIFSLRGDPLKVVGLDLAAGAIEYHYVDGMPVQESISGELRFEGLGITVDGRVQGWVDPSLAFNLEGDVTLGAFGESVGARAVVSTLGWAACGILDIGPIEVSAGAAQYWDGAVSYMAGCDFGPYTDHPRSFASTGYLVDAGLPAAAFAVRGDTAPPAFTLVGPNGERIDATQEGSGPDAFVAINPATNTTHVIVGLPAAGNWRVEPHVGSAQVVQVGRSDALPQPQVKASVRSLPSLHCLTCPAQVELTWDHTPLPGQAVTFTEVGDGVGRVIGTADTASGALTFQAGPGESGQRTIVAMVDQDGLPRVRLPLATY